MRKILIVLIACLFLTTTAYAQIKGDPFADTQDFLEVQKINTTKTFFLGGYLESRNQLALHDMKNPISLRQKIHVEALWKHDIFSVFTSIEGSFEGAAMLWDGDNPILNAQLQEMYLSYDTKNIDLLLGKKNLRWGTGDGINPMDLINPLDTRDPFASGRADNRMPVWMLSGTFSKNNISLEGVFLPKAAVNVLPHLGSPWEPQTLRQLRQQEQAGFISINEDLAPDTWFEDVEFGGRLTTNISGWDISLIAFHGYIDYPVFTQTQNNNAIQYKAQYPTFSALGLSFAKGFANQTIRGELAFKPNLPLQGDFDFYHANVWQSVIGWDYDIDGRYYLNFQLFANLQESSKNYKQRHWYGGTYEISSKWLLDALKIGIRGKIYAEGEGMLNELFIEYAIDDNWKASTGIMDWTGDENTILGEYTENDYIYITLRYSF